ncbi:50S ribosomal protein L21 [Candidatus Neomarinimicrobiota bacterium]
MPETETKGYAIVDYSGYQFRVETGQELKVPYAADDPGANLLLDRVLLLHDGSTTHFGNPVVEGAVVDATILSHGRDPKIIVFKYRRRKGYRRKKGHRQQYSLLRINSIRIEKARPAPKPAAEKAAAVKSEAKTAGKAAPKKPAAAKATTGTKKAESSTAATKKPAAPKKAAPAKKASGTKKSAEAAKKTTAAKKTSGSAKNTATKSSTKKKSSD